MRSIRNKEKRTCRNIVYAVCFSVLSVSGFAQQPTTSDTSRLLERLDQLEKRVQQLERELRVERESKSEAIAGSDTNNVAQASGDHAASVPPPESEPIPARTQEVPDVEHGLHVRVFGQFSYFADDFHGDRPVHEGKFTLLFNSRISDKLSALSEVALNQSGNGTGTFNAVVERATLQYRQNDYLAVTAGRYFSAIGYYNTAFYNTAWAQTTIRRPIIAEQGDNGGLMPMQRNGISVSGRIPSGQLNLHYTAEVGGGDVNRFAFNHSLSIFGAGSQTTFNARAGYNLALFARPQLLRGLQVGGSFFHDRETTDLNGGTVMVGQNVGTLYAAYTDPRWEFLNELYLVRTSVNSQTHTSPMFYSQVTHRLAQHWRPYFRYTYLNGPSEDVLFPDLVGRMGIYEAGARYNISEWVGWKFEYERMNAYHSNLHANAGTTQLVFTF